MKQVDIADLIKSEIKVNCNKFGFEPEVKILFHNTHMPRPIYYRYCVEIIVNNKTFCLLDLFKHDGYGVSYTRRGEQFSIFNQDNYLKALLLMCHILSIMILDIYDSPIFLEVKE